MTPTTPAVMAAVRNRGYAPETQDEAAVALKGLGIEPPRWWEL